MKTDCFLVYPIRTCIFRMGPSLSTNRATKRAEDMAQPNPAQPNPAQPNPAQPNPAQPNPAQPNPAQPNPAQPNPAQPNPAQPNPAQPNPAQSDANLNFLYYSYCGVVHRLERLRSVGHCESTIPVLNEFFQTVGKATDSQRLQFQTYCMGKNIVHSNERINSLVCALLARLRLYVAAPSDNHKQAVYRYVSLCNHEFEKSDESDGGPPPLHELPHCFQNGQR